MFAGKTNHLIANIIAFRIKNYLVCCFKPKLDLRTKNQFFSRDGKVVFARTIAKVSDIPRFIAQIESFQKKKVDIVCFDETHFFALDLVPVIKVLIKQKKMVICAGLNRGFSERILPIMERLRQDADSELFLFAKCNLCKHQATKTQRVNRAREPINPKKIRESNLVGDSDVYEARCDKHFVRF